MGLGQWRGKVDWPEEVKWMKVVTERRIFGFTVCSTCENTLTETREVKEVPPPPAHGGHVHGGGRSRIEQQREECDI